MEKEFKIKIKNKKEKNDYELGGRYYDKIV